MVALSNILSLGTLLSYGGQQPVPATVTLGLEAIKAHFTNAKLVPELLPAFDPSALLTINFSGVGELIPGQLLTKAQSAPTPTVSVTPAKDGVTLDGTYTVMMVDADIVGANLDKGVNRHWLLNGVKVTDGKITNASATSITAYAGPGPAAASGPHRYTVLLYEQPSSFVAPPGFQQPIGVTPMDLAAYVKNSNLGSLIAGNYFRVEDGTATVTPAPTSAVVTSLLPGASSTSAKTTVAPTSTGTPKNGAQVLSSHAFPIFSAVFAGLVVSIII